MPIAVHVVSEQEFADWLAKTKAASAQNDPRQLAAAKE
jgi:heme/copper-type cytochrome/quinol oxidase subunit 2